MAQMQHVYRYTIKAGSVEEFGRKHYEIFGDTDRMIGSYVDEVDVVKLYGKPETTPEGEQVYRVGDDLYTQYGYPAHTVSGIPQGVEITTQIPHDKMLELVNWEEYGEDLWEKYGRGEPAVNDEYPVEIRTFQGILDREDSPWLDKWVRMEKALADGTVPPQTEADKQFDIEFAKREKTFCNWLDDTTLVS